VLSLAGALAILTGVMARATADSIMSQEENIYVSARNPAPIPTEPAVITNPHDGSTTSKSRVDVSGTCEVMDPAIVVVITANGLEAGSTPCEPDGTFLISIAVGQGKQTLIARSLTITGDYGPDSEPVTIFRTNFIDVGALTNEAGNGTPLILTIDEPFIIFGPAKDAIWLGSITGGTLPYHVHIVWGEGKAASDYLVKTSGQQHFVYHYRIMKPHSISFEVKDSGGRGILRYYAAVTPYVPPAGIIGTVRLPFRGSLPLALYGLYLMLLAAFGYLWRNSRPFAYAKVPVPHAVAAARRRRR